MDKLPQLKLALISAFSNLVRKAQRGHPFEDYSDIRDCMMFINLIESTTVDPIKLTAIVDLYLRLFNTIN